jgi:hypothetical protein
MSMSFAKVFLIPIGIPSAVITELTENGLQAPQ